MTVNSNQFDTNPFTRNLSTKQRYEQFEKFYNNNNLYDDLSKQAYINGWFLESMKPIRNPVHRSVEFFASKLLPGNSLNVTANSDAVKNAILQFHKWSNLDSQKNIASRQISLYGDLFWKVTVSNGKIYNELINPKDVRSFTTDNRGYITSIRLDIDQVDENDKPYTYIEYWNKYDQYFATWNVYNQKDDLELEQLGDPVNYGSLKLFGIDFIPFVHAKFSSLGGLRGQNCFGHAISKIEESDRQATRLHELLFNNNGGVWVHSANSVDKNGKGKFASLFSSDDQNLTLKANKILHLPGVETLQTLIPDIKYADALAILNAQIDELEKDLPECRYFDLDTNLSGAALRILMSPAVDRGMQAQNSIVSALKRTDEMALTIGAYLNLPGFTGIGTYENGDFEHNFTGIEMFPISESEKVTLLKDLTSSGIALATALRIAGYDQEFIDQALVDKQSENDNMNKSISRALSPIATI